MSGLSIPHKDLIYKYWKLIEGEYILDIERWILNPIQIQFNISNKHQLDFWDYLNNPKISFELALKYLQKLLDNTVLKSSKITECKEKEIAEKIWNGHIKNFPFVGKKIIFETIRINTTGCTQEDVIYFLRNHWVDTTEFISLISEHYKNKKIGEIVDYYLKTELENYEKDYIEKMKLETYTLELPYITEAKTIQKKEHLLSKFKDLKYDSRVIEFMRSQLNIIPLEL